MAGRKRLVVAVLTYRRTPQLQRLLPLLLAESESLSTQVGDRFESSILVVDNDPDKSARPIVDAVDRPDVHYRTEPRPGIAAARNHALAAADGADLLVFIDDDETPRPGWLSALLQAQRRCAADVVAGRVVSTYDGELDPFIAAGGFHDRSHREGIVTGTPIARAATNNLLLDLRTVRRLGAHFDDRFGLSGGEDSHFTGMLHKGGARMVWCAEAVVHDHVSPDRLTRSYVLRHAANLSNTTVLVELALRESRGERVRIRFRTVIIEGARAAQGCILVVVAAMTGSLRAHARGRRALARSQGSLAALVGHQAMPYART